MLLSRLGRRVLLKRVNSFYRTLSPEQKVLFDNKYLCLKATPKNRGFVFLKFVMSFWRGKLYRKKTKELIANLAITNPDFKTMVGAHPNIERERMLRVLQIPYSVMFSDKPEKFTGPKPFSQMIVICDSSLKKPIQEIDVRVKNPGLKDIPLKLEGYPDFELDHAVLNIYGIFMKDGLGRKAGSKLTHALSCVRLPGGEYKIIEPNGNQDPCIWTDPQALNLFVKSGWYKEAYEWDIYGWGFGSIIYVKNDSTLPKFDVGKDVAKTPVNLGVNKEGHKILVGPRGGKYVQYAVGKAARPEKKALATASTPKKVEKNGINSKGRVIYKGPDGGRFVIVVGKDGKRYKRYIRAGVAIKTPAKKKPVGTNSKGRAIYKGPDGGRYVIVTSKDGKRYKKYMPKEK